MKSQPLVSIITPSFNNVGTIEDTIKSVLNQDYPNIEYIVIDGGSNDGTLDVVKTYSDKISKIVSEPDKGIYDAMNKGIALAMGDIIGIINSDDFYASDYVISKVAEVMEKEKIDCCWGDIFYVDYNETKKVVRRWYSSEYKEGKFQSGWHPPHSAFFVKKDVYLKYGTFNTEFSIAADYELMLRLLEKYKISSYYIPEVLVNMRIGGESNKNVSNIIKANIQCQKAWKVNGLKVNKIRLVLKPLSKIAQYFKK